MKEVFCKNQYEGNGFVLFHGDSCEVMNAIPDNSIHYSIFSPPFASLYTYSNSIRDLGNCRNTDEFYTQFKFIIKELHRILMNGRLVSIHCMDLPAQKSRDGFVGMFDFPGEIIKMMTDEGFVYHSRVTIWKDPQVEMMRRKSLGLLYKTVQKDSSMNRQGMADYIVTFRKLGDNDEPISHKKDDFSLDKWIDYASPVWMDINQSDTLQKESAREEKDEKHICPLQLGVIERCLDIWTNPEDIVFTPFLGIGSEAYQSLKMGRRAVGIELKESYYNQAVANCSGIVSAPKKKKLF